MPKSGVKVPRLTGIIIIDRERACQISLQEGGFPEYAEIFIPLEIHGILKSEYLARLTRHIHIKIRIWHAPAP